jgi:hypothetical protein
MACTKLDELEETFIEVRDQRARAITHDSLSPLLSIELDNRELIALNSIMSHKAGHVDCDPT